MLLPLLHQQMLLGAISADLLCPPQPLPQQEPPNLPMPQHTGTDAPAPRRAVLGELPALLCPGGTDPGVLQ